MTHEPERERALRAYIGDARWFGGKGRDFDIGEVRVLSHGVHLVEVRYSDGSNGSAEGSTSDTYQLPLSSYEEQQEQLGHALVGEWDGRYHYDAVHDRDAMATWLRAFDEGSDQRTDEAVTFHRVPGHALDHEAHSTLFSGEQSNSSVAFGEDSLMKVFRRVTAGHNPDIEIHRVLTEAGSEHVAQLYGWVDTGGSAEDAEPIQLAMLQQFLRTATEGWAFALTSVRNLFAEADLYPEEVGGDFAGEAGRLGAAVAQVHTLLREHFPTGELDVGATARAMHRRLDETIAIAPELRAVAGPARAAYDRLESLDGSTGVLAAQRIHGDLHLGQTLRTALGWKLVDFEGEPAKPLAVRVLPDSPWRDAAGMLRSFDYAAHTVLRDVQVDEEAGQQLEYRSQEWVQRNRDAFLDGYVEAAYGEGTEHAESTEHGESAGLSESDRVLVTAYELDKAVYEVGYELRNRPAWVTIPLAALARAGEAT